MWSQERFPLVAVVGPTASGKTALAVELALRFRGEIVNCDSLQLYAGLDVGTAKPGPEERRGVPHHLFSLLSPERVFSAGEYASLARPVIREIASRQRLPVVTGGTGFYLRALLDGLADAPGRDLPLRQRLEQAESRRSGVLARLLKRLDPAVAARIHPRDRQKLVRAVEICLTAQKPATEVFRAGRTPFQEAVPLVLALNPPRAELHERIAARTRAMFEKGLLEEVRDLLARGVPTTAKSLESIGYRQAVEVLQGRMTESEALEATAISTRQYARRQITWFRRGGRVVWVPAFGGSAEAFTAASRHVEKWLTEFTNCTALSTEQSQTPRVL